MNSNFISIDENLEEDFSLDIFSVVETGKKKKDVRKKKNLKRKRSEEFAVEKEEKVVKKRKFVDEKVEIPSDVIIAMKKEMEDKKKFHLFLKFFSYEENGNKSIERHVLEVRNVLQELKLHNLQDRLLAKLFKKIVNLKDNELSLREFIGVTILNKVLLFSVILNRLVKEQLQRVCRKYPEIIVDCLIIPIMKRNMKEIQMEFCKDIIDYLKPKELSVASLFNKIVQMNEKIVWSQLSISFVLSLIRLKVDLSSESFNGFLLIMEKISSSFRKSVDFSLLLQVSLRNYSNYCKNNIVLIKEMAGNVSTYVKDSIMKSLESF